MTEMSQQKKQYEAPPYFQVELSDVQMKTDYTEINVKFNL